MINETIILLTYYYNQEDLNHPVLRYIIKNYCPAYLPWNLYLHEPLQKIFPKVILYDYLKRRAEIGLKAMNEEVITLVRKEHPKYVLWTSFYYDIQESTLEAIRKEGTTIVGWFFDDEWRFNIYSKYWVPYLDYCVTNAIKVVPKYKELGARVINTIPNTGIAVNRDWSNIEENYDVSFVGSINFADRRQYVKELKKKNIAVNLFGGGSGGYVSFEEMLAIFKTSKINLNFSETGVYYWVRQIKGRVFQVCMAGGFLLTEYAPGIENYFKIDKEIVCFQDAKEMYDKIIYYLNHDEERRAIAQAGWKRATREYTSSHMAARVFSQIEQDMATKGCEHSVCPQRLKMPIWIRRYPSQYHFQWAWALLEQNDKQGLWKDAIALSLWYDSLNILAWYCRAISFVPSSMRPTLFKLYELEQRLRIALLRWLRSITWLRKMAEPLFKKIL